MADQKYSCMTFGMLCKCNAHPCDINMETANTVVANVMTYVAEHVRNLQDTTGCLHWLQPQIKEWPHCIQLSKTGVNTIAA